MFVRASRESSVLMLTCERCGTEFVSPHFTSWPTLEIFYDFLAGIRHHAINCHCTYPGCRELGRNGQGRCAEHAGWPLQT